jgi:hypothetical protein
LNRPGKVQPEAVVVSVTPAASNAAAVAVNVIFAVWVIEFSSSAAAQRLKGTLGSADEGWVRGR